MKYLVRRPYSWLSVLAILFLALGTAQFAACGSGDDDDTTPPAGDDDASPTGDDDSTTQATPTPEAPTPTPVPVTPTPEPEKVNLTFTVDLNIDADGDPDTNLNEVKEGEQVFIVGNMNNWVPNDPDYVMTDNGDGTWTITLSLPVGYALEFKFAKTASDPGDNWSEGEKNYMNDQDPEWTGCPNDETQTEGLFEVANRPYTVPDTDADVGTFLIDAWRETAEAYGLVSCN